jgi:hypothetical protein
MLGGERRWAEVVQTEGMEAAMFLGGAAAELESHSGAAPRSGNRTGHLTAGGS